MPAPKKRSDEDGAEVDRLLLKAQSSTLTPEDVKWLMWVLSPFYDLPAGYIDGKQFFFDANLGLLYEQVDIDERHYLMDSDDKLSSFGVGGGGGGVVNRGRGQFARLAAPDAGKRLKVPLPPFPKIPDIVKSKFPELKDDWAAWEGAVEEWLQHVQNQLS